MKRTIAFAFSAASALLASVCMVGCQDQDATQKDGIPTLEQSQKKPYARKTTETNADGQPVEPGSSGVEVEGVKKPMKIHTGVRFRTELKDESKADNNNKKLNLYPNPPSDPGPGYSFSYADPCPNPQWLQFYWKTHYFDGKSTELADGSYTDRPPHNKDGSVNTGAGKQRSYVTDPAATDPETHLDTAAADSPYYNAEAAHSDDNKTMYDVGQPGDIKNDDTRKAKRETVVYHFSTFLVCDGKVAYHIKYTRTFERKAGDEAFGAGKLDVKDAGPDGKLSDSEKKELGTQFPKAPVPTPTP